MAVRNTSHVNRKPVLPAQFRQLSNINWFGTMSDKVHLFRVEMTCESCAKAVSNVLNQNKDKGIESFDIDLMEKLISIKSTLDSKAILEIIQKTGKSITYLGEKK